MKRLIMMKLHISIHHGIVSATSVSLAGQGLSLTDIIRSIEIAKCTSTNCVKLHFSQTKQPFVKKFDTNLYHNIISAVSVSFSDLVLVFTLC